MPLPRIIEKILKIRGKNEKTPVSNTLHLKKGVFQFWGQGKDSTAKTQGTQRFALS